MRKLLLPLLLILAGNTYAQDDQSNQVLKSPFGSIYEMSKMQQEALTLAIESRNEAEMARIRIAQKLEDSKMEIVKLNEDIQVLEFTTIAWQKRSEDFEARLFSESFKRKEIEEKYRQLSARVNVLSISLGLAIGALAGLFVFTKFPLGLLNTNAYITALIAGVAASSGAIAIIQFFFRSN